MGSDPSITITLDLFTVSLLLAGLLFSFTLNLAKQKYEFLRRANPSFDSKKLLVLSAGTVCFLRIMSIVGVVAMDIANVRAHYSLNPASPSTSQNEARGQPIERNQAFYDSSMTVLFDLPNTIVVSTYVLLTLVWAECSLLSRFHTESTRKWRRRWLVWYMIFNTALYATQVILYILIFIGGRESRGVIVVRNVVIVAMAAINFSAVFIVMIFYLYLSLAWSGFPYRSQRSKEGLRKISNVMALWSVSRIIWGISTLTLYFRNVDLLRPTQAGLWSPLVLFILFVSCEIAPLIVLMDYSFMTIFEFADSATREMSLLATGRHNLTSDRLDETEAQGNIQIEEQDAPALGQSFCESIEPLLGRCVS
ncbi:hypothetical protein ACHAXA_006626 [Cyclostephanos tholiformis]|uniref:THH1/TOM1/TOM3 domain-containing protein n=1 Tax=Cyclostephanos tholiformis TaxID=382380 RepID=A0ABD3R5W0_9STRA